MQSITGIPAAYNARASKFCLVRGNVAQKFTTEKNLYFHATKSVPALNDRI